MPNTAAVWVTDSTLTARAIPKSVTFTRPSSPIMMLAGLMSRWTIPRSWAKCSACAASAPISAARRGSTPSRFMISRSDRPAMYSMTM